MNKAIVYHWWDSYEESPIKNLRVPIIPSIATLRGRNPHIPIYVLDCSQRQFDWLYFPDKLGFQVVPWRTTLSYYPPKHAVEYLSRMADIRQFARQIPQDEIIYCDSDVFWITDPLPLLGTPDLFCSNRHNNGFFYFDKTSLACQKFFDLYNAYALTSLNDKRIRKGIVASRGINANTTSFDEVLTDYIYEMHQAVTCQIPKEEHGLTRDIAHGKVDVRKLKMLHCNGLYVENKFHKINANQRHARGLVCLIFKEFYNSVIQTLSQKDLETIFTCDELNYYTDHQMELNEKYVQRLKALNAPYNKDIHLKDVIRQNSSHTLGDKDCVSDSQTDPKMRLSSP